MPEDKLKDLKQGLKAKAIMKWNDEMKLDVTVDKISYIPMPTSTFDVAFKIDSKTEGQQIYPGMKAKIKLVTFQSDKAIAIPTAAIKEEGDKHYVKMKDGTKRYVITGAKSKGKQVILKGLKAGEEIEPGAPAKK